jgi:ATP-dependent DNA helicase RecQ
VKQGKYVDRRFSDGLVEACERMMRDWQPDPAPTWLTYVPSLRHPNLVRDFAERLACKLGLPFHPVLVKTDERPEQKTMKNTVQQARNVDGSLTVTGDVPRGSVLLVDDLVDSRWTLTVAAYLLRIAGSGEVFPLALSLGGQSE